MAIRQLLLFLDQLPLAELTAEQNVLQQLRVFEQQVGVSPYWENIEVKLNKEVTGGELLHVPSMVTFEPRTPYNVVRQVVQQSSYEEVEKWRLPAFPKRLRTFVVKVHKHIEPAPRMARRA